MQEALDKVCSHVTVVQVIIKTCDDTQASLGRTTIIVAHRLSTIKKADVIAVLEDGRIVEMGTQKELLDYKGMFYKLVVAQVSVACACLYAHTDMVQ